jgi:hypothetical protein
VSEDRRRVCGSEVQIFTVSLNGANILPTPNYSSAHERGCDNFYEQANKILIHKPAPKLCKSPQSPLSHAGPTADESRTKRPPLRQHPTPGEELNPGLPLFGAHETQSRTRQRGGISLAGLGLAIVIPTTPMVKVQDCARGTYS